MVPVVAASESKWKPTISLPAAIGGRLARYILSVKRIQNIDNVNLIVFGEFRKQSAVRVNEFFERNRDIVMVVVITEQKGQIFN